MRSPVSGQGIWVARVDLPMVPSPSCEALRNRSLVVDLTRTALRSNRAHSCATVPDCYRLRH